MVDRTKVEDKLEQLSYLEVDTIQPNRFQPRKTFSEQELEQLSDSIDQHGLLQPITVRKIDDGEGDIEYEIIAGERRWRAHKFLHKTRIKAIIKEDVSDERSMEAALIENLQREDLNPMEEAESIVALQRMQKLTQEQLAQRLGKSRAYISQVVRLVRLPDDVQQLIREGQLDSWHGTVIVAAPKEMQSELAEKAVKGKWNIDTLRKRVASIKEEDSEGESEKTSKPKKQLALSGNLILIECPGKGAVKELMEELSKDEDLKLWTGRREIKAALEEEKVAEESTDPVTEDA
jgi:ParB family transcriptional regulator, chromosome partitioning protein